MAHSSELRWEPSAAAVTRVAEGLLEVIQRAEEKYQELLEAYQYSGGTDTTFAELLFENPTPTAEEISKAKDLRLAMVAAHQLYEAMTDVAVTKSNRAAALRRMS